MDKLIESSTFFLLVIILIAIFYSNKIELKLPTLIILLFRSDLFKILIIYLVINLYSNNQKVSIFTGIFTILLIKYINNYYIQIRVKENFCSDPYF